MSFYFKKQPFEKYRISVDFANVLGEGEEILEYEVLATDDDTTEGDAILEGTVVSQKVIGGEHNKEYGFSFRIETSEGQRFEEDVVMTVREKGPKF